MYIYIYIAKYGPFQDTFIYIYIYIYTYTFIHIMYILQKM